MKTGLLRLVSAIVILSSALGAPANRGFTTGRLKKGEFGSATITGIAPAGSTFTFERVTPESSIAGEIAGRDGSGPGHGLYWKVECKVDAMTDARWCELWDASSNTMTIFVRPGGAWGLCLPAQSNRFRPGLLRINSEPPIVFPESACIGIKENDPLLIKMKAGALVRVRAWNEFYRQYDLGAQFNVAAFGDGLLMAKFMLAGGAERLAWPSR